MSEDDLAQTPPQPPDAEEAPPQRSMRHLKIAAVLVVITMLVVAQRFGVFRQFSDAASITKTIQDLGPWGYLAFVLVYATLQPFGIPGTIFVVAASLIWPWPIAYALSMTGTMAASVVGFSFARFVARDWISTLIPKRFRKYDDALAKPSAITTVFLLRLIFWMPPLLHASFGISKVRFWTHFWGSFAGYLIPLFLMSFFGQRLFDYVSTAPRSAWIATAVAIATIAVGVWIWRRRTKRAAD